MKFVTGKRPKSFSLLLSLFNTGTLLFVQLPPVRITNTTRAVPITLPPPRLPVGLFTNVLPAVAQRVYYYVRILPVHGYFCVPSKVARCHCYFIIIVVIYHYNYIVCQESAE